MPQRLWSAARQTLGFALMLAALSGIAYAQQSHPDAPEIDAGSAASALTLLIGGAMLLKDRLRSK